MSQSLDSAVVQKLFAALAEAQQGHVGKIRILTTTTEGIQGLTVLAVDEIAFLQHIEPALRAAKIPVVDVNPQR
jgi:hypothetical protein